MYSRCYNTGHQNMSLDAILQSFSVLLDAILQLFSVLLDAILQSFSVSLDAILQSFSVFLDAILQCIRYMYSVGGHSTMYCTQCTVWR